MSDDELLAGIMRRWFSNTVGNIWYWNPMGDQYGDFRYRLFLDGDMAITKEEGELIERLAEQIPDA